MAIPLPTSLWAMIDAYLKTEITTWAAQYNELVDLLGNPHVEIGEQFDPGDVDFPFILIRSYERGMSEGDPLFGDGEFHMTNMTYEYEIVMCNAFETTDLTKHFCSNSIAALVDFLRQDVTLGGMAASDGEHVEQFEFDDHEIYVRGLAGQERGKYGGYACVRFNVYTEI